MAKQTNSLAHTKWMCKYHIVIAHIRLSTDCRIQLILCDGNRPGVNQGNVTLGPDVTSVCILITIVGYGAYSENYREFLTTMNKWYSEGLIGNIWAEEGSYAIADGGSTDEHIYGDIAGSWKAPRGKSGKRHTWTRCHKRLHTHHHRCCLHHSARIWGSLHVPLHR